MENKIYKDPANNRTVAGNSTEDNMQKIDFLFHSACSFPFVPMVDLSFAVNELITLIKAWKQRKNES